jgi:glycosyltransferase involved in cell wall biosynthesis
VIGGVEINTHELMLELIHRGRHAAVLSKLSLKDAFGAVRWMANLVCRREIAVDATLGYTVYRSRRPWADLDGIPMPRSVVIQNGNMIEIGRAFARRGVPSIAYFHGLPFEVGSRNWATEASELPFSAYIANSRYTADRFRSRFGIDAEVIPPIFRPERYRSQGNGRHVTFINPVVEKGADLALAVAKLCPEIPFRFVKGWPLPARQAMQLKARISRLANVELVDRQRDMLPIYAATRVLLVPSQCPETWGRVATEAQFSGTPVLATNIGALPESVGPGGTIVDPNAAPEVWAAELRGLWHDKTHYARLRDAALSHSRRSELEIEHQVDRFLSVVEGVAA